MQIRPIALDWVERKADFTADGQPSPQGGLLPNGRLETGGRTRRIVLERPPRGSADMLTTAAFLDVRGARYWALQSGGFFYRERWVGPFALKRR